MTSAINNNFLITVNQQYKEKRIISKVIHLFNQKQQQNKQTTVSYTKEIQ